MIYMLLVANESVGYPQHTKTLLINETHYKPSLTIADKNHEPLCTIVGGQLLAVTIVPYGRLFSVGTY